jgi:hypothetical protein
LEAEIVRETVLLPLAARAAVPLAGFTVMSAELVVAVHEVVSANVVDAIVTVTDCEPPLPRVTVVVDGEIW